MAGGSERRIVLHIMTNGVPGLDVREMTGPASAVQASGLDGLFRELPRSSVLGLRPLPDRRQQPTRRANRVGGRRANDLR
jgi:hypothetical protein